MTVRPVAGRMIRARRFFSPHDDMALSPPELFQSPIVQ
jgi:hypothetical protein